MKSTIAFALVLFASMTSFADPASDQAANKAACNSEVTPADARIIACTNLINDTSYVDPTATAYVNRGFTYYQNKRYAEALNDIQVALTKDPKNYWNHYFEAKCYVMLQQNDNAFAAFKASLEIKPDYCPSLVSRASLYKKLKQFETAIADYSTCLNSTAFDSNVYVTRGATYEEMGKNDLAIRDFKIAGLLNENNGYPLARLEDLAPIQNPNPTLAPMDFSEPQTNLKIRYIQVLVPRDMRDEYERAMDGLIDWFKPRPKALPVAAAIATRTIVETKNEETKAKLDMEFKLNVPAVVPESTNVFRALLPVSSKMGANGPELRIVFDRSQLAPLWPLTVGKTIAGNGTLEIECPTVETPMSKAMGCKPNIFLPIGKFEYNVLVEKTEQVLVPAGLFNTYVVRYREIGEIEILGKKQKREVETKYWMEPTLNWWVRRTNQEGDNIAIIEAMDIFKP